MKDYVVLSVDISPLSESTADGLASLLRSAGRRAHVTRVARPAVDETTVAAIESALRPFPERDVLVINHTRQSLSPALDKVRHVVSYMQDESTALAGREDEWNRCEDHIIGFTTQARGLGYESDRCIETPMFQCPFMFGESAGVRELPLLFLASNKGDDPLEHYWRSTIRAMPQLEGKLSAEGAARMLAAMREASMALDRPTTFEGLRHAMLAAGGPVASLWTEFGEFPRFNILMYWHIYERVYRQTVSARLLKAGAPLRVAGDGWRANPAFVRVAEPTLPRRKLKSYYQGCKWSLHLNSSGGYHHRLAEILLSGGLPLLHDHRKWRRERFDRTAFVGLQTKYLVDTLDTVENGSSRPSVLILEKLTNLWRYCDSFSDPVDVARDFKRG